MKRIMASVLLLCLALNLAACGETDTAQGSAAPVSIVTTVFPAYDFARQIAGEYGLTRREEEVLGYILSGASSEEISGKLCITRNPLFKHSQNLYRKCGVKSRWDLLKLLWQTREE